MVYGVETFYSCQANGVEKSWSEGGQIPYADIYEPHSFYDARANFCILISIGLLT